MAADSIIRALIKLFGGKPSDYIPGKSGDIEGQTALSWAQFLRSGLDPYNSFAQISQDRIVKYNEYDLCDQYSDIATALDIYAEEASQPDPHKGLVIWVESEDKELFQVGNRFLRTIRAEDRVWAVARNIAKYGDTFEYLLTNQFGIYGLQFIHPSRISRVETDHLIGFQCDDLARLIFKSASGGPEGRFFLPWDFVHFRIESFDRETVYGRSMIENVRKTWKELQILETMIAVFRITKGVERNIFYVDVGQATPQEAKNLVEKWKQHLRKSEFIDPVTGEFKIDMRAVVPQDDMIIPTRRDSATKVEKLAASPDIGAIEDLKYFRGKLRTALGIPQSYFDNTLESTGWNSKEALVMQDQRFSRKISRLRRAIIAGFTRMVAIHYTLSKTNWSPGKFEVKMAPINQITVRLKEEWWLRRTELLNGILPLASVAGFDQKEWNDYVLKEILPMPKHVREKLTAPSPESPADASGSDDGAVSGGFGGKAKAGKPPLAPSTGSGSIGKFKSFDKDKDSDEDDAAVAQLLGDGETFMDDDLQAVRDRMQRVLNEVVDPEWRDRITEELEQEANFQFQLEEELKALLVEVKPLAEATKGTAEGERVLAMAEATIDESKYFKRPKELIEIDSFKELVVSDPEIAAHQSVLRRMAPVEEKGA